MIELIYSNLHVVQWHWFAIAGIVLIVIFRMKKPKKRHSRTFPLLSKGIVSYQPEPIMNTSEKLIYRELVRILGKNYYVFPQCSMGGFIRLSSQRSLSRKLESYYRSPFNSKRVDFVIADRKRSLPILIIEFNGSGPNGHNQGNYIFRDIEKSFSASTAGIPLLVLPGHIIKNEASGWLTVNKEYLEEQLSRHSCLTLPT